jgi:uncharacterized integral membrane protein (TIGR00698 family)
MASYFYPLICFIAAPLLLLLQIYPGIALLLGACASLLINQEHHRAIVSRLSKRMLGCSIVAYGLTMHIDSIVALSIDYLPATLSGIILALTAAIALGRLLKIDALLAVLIGSGTAICGASAIASVATATKAQAEKVSMALGVVLILNAVGLMTFPFIGHLCGLSSESFAVWAGLAIHDTSSVVGATLSYDPSSVETATTVKLARAIWIAPLTVLCARYFLPQERSYALSLPWFIWGYLIAALLNSSVALPHTTTALFTTAARMGFVVGIFYIGATVDMRKIIQLGARPCLLGIAVWIVSAMWSFMLVR